MRLSRDKDPAFPYQSRMATNGTQAYGAGSVGTARTLRKDASWRAKMPLPNLFVILVQ